MSTTVILADDHPVVREGVKMLLEREKLEVVGEASNGFEAITLAQQLRPDVVLLDVAMPMLNGLSAIEQIKRVSPRSKTVLLTMYTDEHYVLQALRAGVKGCVSKAQAAEHLLEAIAEVCAGGVYLSPSVSGAVVEAYLSKNDPPPDPLTGRERQVLQLVAEGKTTKEIAVILSVTVKTAESHRSKLMEKLDIHSTAGLVRYAIRRGLVVA
jgi:DNA-binding NarL/FixJ family response regulator